MAQVCALAPDANDTAETLFSVPDSSPSSVTSLGKPVSSAFKWGTITGRHRHWRRRRAGARGPDPATTTLGCAHMGERTWPFPGRPGPPCLPAWRPCRSPTPSAPAWSPGWDAPDPASRRALMGRTASAASPATAPKQHPSPREAHHHLSLTMATAQPRRRRPWFPGPAARAQGRPAGQRSRDRRPRVRGRRYGHACFHPRGDGAPIVT